MGDPHGVSGLGRGRLPVAQHDRRRDDVVVGPRAARGKAARLVAADDHRACALEVLDLGSAAPPEVGAPRLEDDAFPLGPQERQRQQSRCQRQAGVEVEDVEPRQRPSQGAQLLREVERDGARAARVAELQVDVEAPLERPFVENEQRAVDTELAQPLRDRAGPAGDVHGRVEHSHSGTF